MLTYSDAAKQVSAGTLAPVYLLAGGDAFLEDFFIDEVVKGFLPPGTRKLVFSLDDDRADQVLAELTAYALFQERQVMVVRQVRRITGAARAELLAYAGNPDPGKCLLLVMEEYQPSRGLHKELAKTIPVVDTRPPFPDKLRSIASYYVRQKGFIIQPEALDLLLDLAGDTAGHVVSELEKIFTSLQEGEVVTRELVAAQVAPDKSYQLWHFQEAVARREMERSLRIAVSLMEYGTRPTQVVGALATLFGQLLFIHTGTTAERVYTGLNKPVTARLKAMQNLYSLNETCQILRKLLAADVSLKSTPMEPSQVLIALVAGICKGVV